MTAAKKIALNADYPIQEVGDEVKNFITIDTDDNSDIECLGDSIALEETTIADIIYFVSSLNQDEIKYIQDSHLCFNTFVDSIPALLSLDTIILEFTENSQDSIKITSSILNKYKTPYIFLLVLDNVPESLNRKD